MASLRDIRRRIRSVKNIQQITRAMKMVAAAKLRRAQDHILATRPYALELKRVIGNVASRQARIRHPLLEQRDEERVLVVVVTGDKGLCGSFNANVLRRAQLALQRGPETELLLLGKKGVDFYRRRKVTVRAAHPGIFAGVDYETARSIADEIGRTFVDGTYGSVQLIYNQFKSLLTQELAEEQLLPIIPSKPTETLESLEYTYEPSAAAILGELLPRFLTFQVYRVLLESQAAEHAARMTAMDASTKNANEMIDRLTLKYNRARQAAITTELIEVVSGANALEL